MKPITKWAILAVLVVLIGGSIIFAAWRVWQQALLLAGRPPTEEQRRELKKRLDENPRAVFMYDPFTSYRFKPFFSGFSHDSDAIPHETNSLGILGKGELNPDPAVRKVLFLGDSVAFGEHLPREQNLVSRMQEIAGPSFQLLNAACPGWSTRQELLAYKHHFSRLPLGAVVVVFCLNDLLQFEWVWGSETGFRMSAELEGLGGLALGKLTARSLKNVHDRFYHDPQLKPLAMLNNTCYAAYLPERWEEYSQNNLPLFREAAGRQALLVVALPLRPQLESLNLGGKEAEVLYPQRRLGEFCADNGFGFLDLLPAFATATGGERPAPRRYRTDLFYDDLHLSPEGHRRAAEYLWGEVKAAAAPR